MRSVIIPPVALALSACATAPPPYAVAESSPSGMSLAEATQTFASIDLAAPLHAVALANIAVLTNPDLKAMRLKAGVAEAQVFAAGLLPDPTFSLGADFPIKAAGEVIALAASLGLDLAGHSLRPARVASAEANVASIRQDILWAEWLTREKAKLLASRIAWLEKINVETAEYRRLASEDLERAVAAAARGDIAAIEVNARRLAAADASDRARSAENELASARLDLNRLLGIAPSESVSVVAPGFFGETVPTTEEMFRLALKDRADLKGLRSGLNAANAGVAIADASRFPLPGVSLNAGRDSGNFSTVGPAVSFTLPVWNRARGDIAIAKADLSVLEAEYQARVETVRADIGAARTAMIIARHQHADVIRDLAGLADLAGKAQSAAKRGDISDTSAAATHIAVLDKEILTDTLALATIESAIALETAVGQPLDTIQ